MPVILILLLALFQYSFAQCQTSKTIYLQVPEGWSKTDINIYYEGTAKTVLATPQGDWSVFQTFSFSYDTRFAFSKNQSTGLWSNNNWIKQGNSGYNTTSQPGSISDEFQCTVFGSSTVIYIYPDPANPSNTVVSSEPPDSKTFYLLPPGTSDYIGGIPYLMNVGTLEQEPMGMDTSACGWYKKKYFNEPVPDTIIIGLGKYMRSPIGGGKIAIAHKFDSLESNVIYYHADTDRWLKTRAGIPEEANRCSYKFTAIIYDSDNSISTNFKSGDAIGAEGPGISKGIVGPTLNANKKMVWAGNGYKGNDGWTEANFIDAFKSTPGKNVQRCYEMPFVRSSESLWEFNSNKLCANGQMDPSGACSGTYGGYMGGFFPLELQSPFKDSDGVPGDYSLCAACKNLQKAETWAPLASNVNKWCYERGWLGAGSATSIESCNRQFTNGDFKNGDTPTIPGYSSTGIWNWDGRPKFSNGKDTSYKNLFFCFESHAEFVYDPAQEFYFSGDDDIWIYINNQLVIDLGGSHLAAPGYVKLDTITVPERLVEGHTYPIDIFFCDSRSTMSNVSIKSNIYFAQKPVNGREPGLYKQIASTGDEICLQESAASCAALRNGGDVAPICGAALAERLSYKLAVPGWGEVQLDTDNPKCDWFSSTFAVCYGGIMLKDGIVKVIASSVAEAEGGYLAEHGFDLYATVAGYASLNVSKAASTPIKPNLKPNPVFAAPQYYNLKGEPLGSKKPAKTGAYIVRQNGANKVVIVK